MSFTVTEDLLFAARMSKQEMAMELAVIMCHRGNLPVHCAAEFAEMDEERFRYLLLSRGIERPPEEEEDAERHDS
jgi:predicted HTH domain antitoxin